MTVRVPVPVRYFSRNEGPGLPLQGVLQAHSPQLSAPYKDCLCWRGPPHSKQGSLCKWYIEGMLAGKICKGGMEEGARRSQDAGSAEVYPWSGNFRAWRVPQRCLPLRRSPGFFTLISGSHWLWAALSWGTGWQGVDLPSISRWSSFLGQEKVQLRALRSPPSQQWQIGTLAQEGSPGWDQQCLQHGTNTIHA